MLLRKEKEFAKRKGRRLLLSGIQAAQDIVRRDKEEQDRRRSILTSANDTPLQVTPTPRSATGLRTPTSSASPGIELFPPDEAGLVSAFEVSENERVWGSPAAAGPSTPPVDDSLTLGRDRFVTGRRGARKSALKANSAYPPVAGWQRANLVPSTSLLLEKVATPGPVAAGVGEPPPIQEVQ